jgi:DNA-binding transcriptional LysR family regulator
LLDVHRLRLLRELSHRGTIAAVADALGYSHSTVSQQLAQLERQARTRLLERVGRGVRLTPAARVLVAHADAVLTQLEQAEAELADLAAGSAGQLRFAMFPSAAHALLPLALDQLARLAPQLEVTVQVLEHEQALPRLLAHDLDLVLTEEYPGHPLPRTRNVHRARLATDRLLLTVAKGTTISGSLSAAADSVWVLEPPGTAARTWAEAQCRLAGFEPTVRYESIDLALHLRLVQHGLANALLPELTIANDSSDVTLIPLPHSPARLIDTAVRPGSRLHPHVTAMRTALATAAQAVSAARPHITSLTSSTQFGVAQQSVTG